MQFYLGTHMADWLGKTPTPLFVSARRLRRIKTLPRAQFTWALDSGGFSEIAEFGEWRTSAMQYATEVRGWMRDIGRMQFCAPRDWMCEPQMVEKTGLSVLEHQRRTVADYLLLRRLNPSAPWCPVLQGWEMADYLRCADMYGEAGVQLAALPVVGLGSVCRRQDTGMAEELIRELHGRGFRNLHGFGFKIGGLRRVGHLLASADSMAWSYQARRNARLEGCTHLKCSNCLRYALLWRMKAIRAWESAGQAALPFT